MISAKEELPDMFISLWEYTVCQSVSSVGLHLPEKDSQATWVGQKLLSKE